MCTNHCLMGMYEHFFVGMMSEKGENLLIVVKKVGGGKMVVVTSEMMVDLEIG